MWSRVNATGAVAALAIGFVLGMSKLVLQSLFGAGKIESPALLAAIGDFNFLYFSGVLFLICVVIMIAGSMSGPAPDQERIRGLTFSSLDRAAVRASWGTGDIIATGTPGGVGRYRKPQLFLEPGMTVETMATT